MLWKPDRPLVADAMDMGTSRMIHSSGAESRYRFLASFVRYDGEIMQHSRIMGKSGVLIRPCICLDLKKYRQIKGEWK